MEVPVKAGDFFDVPAGTIHAIGAGVKCIWRHSRVQILPIVSTTMIDGMRKAIPVIYLKQAADVLAIRSGASLASQDSAS